jgi:GntR family transcriptional regulator, transcriptional repressor for pyruvate dehydrogenase complex
MVLKMNGLVQTESNNLTDRVASVLRDEITGGTFRPGDVLPPEQVIAARLGVSRTVLREAVSRLKVDGLVTSKQGRGLVVLNNRPSSVLRLHSASEHDQEELIAIVELRLGFEIEAAAFAAERRDEADLAEMREALEQMRDAVASAEVSAGVDADFRFHQAIARATRNPNYITFFEFFTSLYRRNLLVSRARSAKTARGEQAQKEHEAIYAAIRKGDPELARNAARKHVENTGARLRSAGGLLKPVARAAAPRAARKRS